MSFEERFKAEIDALDCEQTDKQAALWLSILREALKDITTERDLFEAALDRIAHDDSVQFPKHVAINALRMTRVTRRRRVEHA